MTAETQKGTQPGRHLRTGFWSAMPDAPGFTSELRQLYGAGNDANWVDAGRLENTQQGTNPRVIILLQAGLQIFLDARPC